jgi:hypothetical protein
MNGTFITKYVIIFTNTGRIEKNQEKNRKNEAEKRRDSVGTQ